jgi:hypothetical protein
MNRFNLVSGSCDIHDICFRIKMHSIAMQWAHENTELFYTAIKTHCIFNHLLLATRVFISNSH